MAKEKKSCIVFFDEIDAVGGIRYGDGDDQEV
jgi:26S proteasome regulatory subunit T1